MLSFKNPQLLLTLVISIFFSSQQAKAQNKIPIQGIVTDKETHDPLNAVTVSWKNKGIGSISNTEGRFIISIPGAYTSTDSLTFSCLGYQPQKVVIPITDSGKELQVSLSRAVTDLKEVSIKRLSLKQLLDSIGKRNANAFAPQMILKGYYREFVYTNAKCTAYADAMCAYYYNRNSAPEGQMSITASRCLKETKNNQDKDNIEVYKESRLNPNTAFSYAMLSGMIDQYFPAKILSEYEYTMEEAGVKDAQDLKIVIAPKKGMVNELYQLTLYLTSDYTLTSYQLEIPEPLLAQAKEKSMLGIHSKVTATRINVNYTKLGNDNYPSYYAVYKSARIWGKFFGTTIDQAVINKSEFIVSDADNSSTVKAFPKQEIYKKGNICSNGTAMNDETLKNHTMIIPSAAEAAAIKGFTE